MFYFIFLCLSFIFIQWTSTADLNPRVFGADDLQFNVHQYLVHLVSHRPMSVSTCSGSILSERWIISAAHCFEGDILHVRVQKVYFWAFRKLIAEVDGSCITILPDYTHEPVTYEDLEKDLALLKTTKNILFDSFTKPIRLAWNRPKVGQQAVIAGYGESEYGSAIPRKGSALLTKCSGSDAKLLCTYSTVRAGSGDSGGALVLKGRLIGVISASCEYIYIHQNCESYYVDVTQHLNWIKSITGIQ